MKRPLKAIVSISILIITAGFFLYYFATHPVVREQLVKTSPLVLAALLGLYLVFTVSLALILKATLVLCQTTLPATESILLTIYSSIVNFFGPLQSGPGFRAVYLKKRYGVKLKNFTLATLLYYAFFAGFSALCLMLGLVPFWAVIMLAGAGLLVLLGLWKTHWSFVDRFKKLNLRGIGYLAMSTLLQVLVVAVIYFMELHSVNPHISFRQAIIYTGAANFALFVSLTPGAIGFRETFLLFSSGLHGIDRQTVLTASVIDRAFYVVFLGLLFLAGLVFHANEYLQVHKIKEAAKAEQ